MTTPKADQNLLFGTRMGISSVAAAVLTNAARHREVASREEAQQLADRNAGLVADERAKGRQLEEQLRISAVTRLAAQSQAIRKELPVTSVLLAIEAVESTRKHDGTIMPVAHETLLSTPQNVGGLPAG